MQRQAPETVEDLLEIFMEIDFQKGAQAAINQAIECAQKFDFSRLQQDERIYAFDTAVKLGNLDLVKVMAERYIDSGLSDDIRIPSENNMEVPFRPTFWLPSIVTRQEYAGKESYAAIEKYLSEKFDIPEKVNIDGEMLTRDQYCKNIDAWKHQNNIRMFNMGIGMKKPRYRRHELMDAIEKGVELKKPTKK